MDTKWFILILLVINIGIAHSQNCDNVERFKGFYKDVRIHDDENTSNNSITRELYLKLFGKSHLNEYTNIIEPKEIMNFSNGKGYMIEIFCTMGGYCSGQYLVFFNEDCSVRANISIGYFQLDKDGGTKTSYKIINDSVLESHIYEEFEEENVPEESNWPEPTNNYRYIVVGKDSVYRAEKSTPSTFRQYPIASKRVLSLEELRQYKKRELDIMRNEIFADYSYRFKTEKWKNYFDTIMQYIPHYDNVSDKLTVIERINIQRILKVAPMK